MAYYVHGSCISCGYCKKVCPTGAVTFHGLGYEIDPEVCVSCGACADACRMGIIFPDGYVRQIAYHPPKQLDCDVLVIGGGVAGLVAAARAAEQGRQVILLEKLPKLGGGSQFAQGVRMFSSQMEREAGVPDQMDDYIRSALNSCRWEVSPHLIANVFHALPACFDWMCQWAPIRENWSVRRGAFGTMAVMPNSGHDAGRFITEQLEQYCRAHGVQFLTECAAKKLILEDGKLTGVQAEDAGGILQIRCRACLLATGNISYGDVLKRALPECYYAESYASSHRLPSNTGDHVAMAEDAGIAVDYDSITAAYLGGMMALGTDLSVMPQAHRGSGLKVNQDGKRWINESVNQESAIWAQLRQPGCVSFTILNREVLYSPMEPPYLPVVNRTGRNIAEGIPGPDGKFAQEVHIGPPGGHGGGAKPGDPEETLRTLAALEGGHVFVADTPEELAQAAGIPKEELTATLERYNELCRKGHDDDFYKLPEYLISMEQGPFFAIRTHMATDGIFGGLDADEHMAVMNRDVPVEGLYCAGDTVGNRYVNQGGEKLECINDFSWAFGSGYLAGQSILTYLESEAL